MSEAREIRERIDSINNTLKITNAMYMISSTKMNAAKAALARTEPYFDRLRAMFARVSRHLPEDFTHPYLDERKDTQEEDARRAVICVTSDKGLAGAYNHNVLKLAEETIRREKGDKLFVIGEFGYQYMEHHGIHIDEAFHYTAQKPTLSRARQIATRMLSLFESDEVDEVYIVYTYMINSMETEARVEQLLPLHHLAGEQMVQVGSVMQEEFELYPSAKVLLDNIVPDYVGGYIYSALVESYCAEHSARMQAMDSANKSGSALVSQLSIHYNRVRQAQITQEITEVAAGAKARKQQMQAQARRHAKKKRKEP